MTPRRFPIVFTSALHPDQAGDDVSPLGHFGNGLTQTPQVWLDHQVTEREGALDYNWDSLAAIFDPNMLDAMFSTFGRLLDRLADDAAWQQCLPAAGPAIHAPPRSASPIPREKAPVLQDSANLPVTVVREAIATAFEEVLDEKDLLTDANFFELGATSLSLIRIRHRLQQSLDLHFPVIEMFAHPTMAALATHLAGLSRRQNRDLTPTMAAPGTSLAGRHRAEKRRFAKRNARVGLEVTP
jgi:non-ribosomal peptide synthetase component F